MDTTEPLDITPPDNFAYTLKEKLQSGENAGDSELIDDGLRALLARNWAVESWLMQQLAPAWDALKVNPSRALSSDEVRTRLAAAHAKA